MKNSTSVILAKRSTKSSFNYKLLLLKRSAKARFFPGAHVFAGGILEDSDLQERWKQWMPPSLEAQHVKREEGTNPAPEWAFRVNGIREVFEESNILLVDRKLSSDSVQSLRQWRSKIQEDTGRFYEMFDSLQVRPHLEGLFPWAHWITPVSLQYRYNTLFYLAEWNSELTGTTPLQDNKETTALDWLSPGEALAEYEKGTILLSPPTWYLLSHLMRWRDLDQLLQVARRKRWDSIQPELATIIESSDERISDSASVIPSDRHFRSSHILHGDECHSSPSPGGRNRIIISTDPNDSSFETWRYHLHQSEQFSINRHD